MNQYSTPILFIIFNKIDTTQKVFNEIKKQKPKYLFIAADGPREWKKGEQEKCQQVRDIIKQIDWDCELKTLFSNENHGCAIGPKNAIDWFFSNVEEGIVLEDDCLPHPDFFEYCKALLSYYRKDKTAMLISGNNFQAGHKRGNASYFFTAYPNTWGWATWKRVWEGYDFYLENYSYAEYRVAIKKYFPDWYERRFWMDRFIRMKKRTMDAWDFQLLFHIWRENGLCICPNVNLVSNIGFGEDATHTQNVKFSKLNLPTYPILPIVHTEKIERDLEADLFHHKTYTSKTLVQLTWRWIMRIVTNKPKF